MRVFDITKEYKKAFADFTPNYVLAKIGDPDFHTKGELATDGEDHYAAGILQYYDGYDSDKDEARIVYIYVPEDERGESNAWSMLNAMESDLKTRGIKRVTVFLGGEDTEKLKGYFQERGFKAIVGEHTMLKTVFSDMVSDKVLKIPPSRNVTPMKDVPISELKRICDRLPKKELAAAGISVSGGIDENTKKLSFVYHDGDTEGIFVSSVMPEGGILVRILKCVGKDSAKAAFSMLSFAGNKLKRSIPKDTPVFIMNVSGMAQDLIKKFSPEASVYEVWRGEKKLKRR